MHQDGRVVVFDGYIWELIGDDDGNMPSDSPESPWNRYVAYQPPDSIPAWVPRENGYSEGHYVRHGQGSDRFIYMSRFSYNRHEPGVFGWMQVESFTGPPGNRTQLTIPGGAVAPVRAEQAAPQRARSNNGNGNGQGRGR